MGSDERRRKDGGRGGGGGGGGGGGKRGMRAGCEERRSDSRLLSGAPLTPSPRRCCSIKEESLQAQVSLQGCPTSCAPRCGAGLHVHAPLSLCISSLTCGGMSG